VAVGMAIDLATDELMAQMGPQGWWEGRLSSSALSTATAISALCCGSGQASGGNAEEAMVGRAVNWLVENQNGDGGWGDTPQSPSNLPTTLLAWSALRLGKGGETCGGVLERTARYVDIKAGGQNRIVKAVGDIYGEDGTFAVPILMNCALAGLVQWERVPALPFELAAFPQSWYRMLRLQVVSYALPALIAIGLAIHHRHRRGNPITRALRSLVETMVLRKLQHIQPEGGGFLEAVPLTSFVAMSLIPHLGAGNAVASGCLEFLRHTHRPDGSWPIDSNLSVWLTSAAVAALEQAGRLGRIEERGTLAWLVRQQCKVKHPYTGAAPGGWGWTHLPGGVPDVDDTSGAILALWSANADGANATQEGCAAGVRWLLDIQNRDGGWPTFCRGWGKLPFDRSSPDLTAHALRALHRVYPQGRRGRVSRAMATGLRYLGSHQQTDGSWRPLWFGNQGRGDLANPVLGTARVLRALEELAAGGAEARLGVKYLLAAQNGDGGWGSGPDTEPTTEETAVAVGALAGWRSVESVDDALSRGVSWLLRAMDSGLWKKAAPIGLYFSNLWYSERMYPLIWTLDAMGRVAAVQTGKAPPLVTAV